MAKDQAKDDVRPDIGGENTEYGSAGHETGARDASAMGTAGIYAAPVNEESDEETLNTDEEAGKAG